MSFLCPAWRDISPRTIYLFQTGLGLLPVVWITYAILHAIFFPQYATFDPTMFVMATLESLLVVGWITSLVGGLAGYWLLERRIRFAATFETDEKRQGK